MSYEVSAGLHKTKPRDIKVAIKGDEYGVGNMRALSFSPSFNFVSEKCEISVKNAEDRVLKSKVCKKTRNICFKGTFRSYRRINAQLVR